MEKLLEGAKTEERAVNEEESKQIDELGKQIEAIDKTIESDEKLRAFQTSVKDPEERGTETETTEETEVRAFADFVRGSITEERAGEMTFGDNGAVIPRTIAAKIIQKVYDMCPITGIEQSVSVAAVDAITADELIDLQEVIKDAFQRDSIWIMAPSTRTAIRKLKDGNGRYMLQDDINNGFGYSLLGKPVYVSDNMPAMATGANAIYYGDMSGLAVKFVETLEIQILREHYATQHALGAVGWIEFDSKVENAQKIAQLTMALGMTLGETREVPDDVAKEFIKIGHVEAVEEKKSTKAGAAKGKSAK
ncbi:Phage capsid family [Popillia japonica]|uniref:Phage capsid family n=1 Tax=Popillia japonica TaxID=7064 RepID=A0AAW1HVY4_POPJA